MRPQDRSNRAHEDDWTVVVDADRETGAGGAAVTLDDPEDGPPRAWVGVVFPGALIGRGPDQEVFVPLAPLGESGGGSVAWKAVAHTLELRFLRRGPGSDWEYLGMLRQGLPAVPGTWRRLEIELEGGDAILKDHDSGTVCRHRLSTW